jgi:DNA-binding MarR family transcriptional regulator
MNENELNKFAERVFYAMEEIGRLTQSFSNVPEMSVEMTHSQMLVTGVLGAGSKTMSELSQMTGMSASALTGVIDRLLDKKLVERDRDENDRRLVRIKLSEEGGKIVSEMHELIRIKTAKFFERMSPEDRTNFVNIIEKVVANIKEEQGK